LPAQVSESALSAAIFKKQAAIILHFKGSTTINRDRKLDAAQPMKDDSTIPEPGKRSDNTE